MRSLYVAIAGLALVMAAPAEAQEQWMNTWTGEEFLRHCGDPMTGDPKWVNYPLCRAYVSGVVAAARFSQDVLNALARREGRPEGKHFFCLPANSTMAQVIDLTLHYFQLLQEGMRIPAAASVMNALILAWPCEDQPPVD